MKTYTTTAKLLRTTRRNCSFYGNPAWTLCLEYDNNIIYAKTASDSQAGYSVENHKIGDNITIRGHYTRNGNFIIDYIQD